MRLPILLGAICVLASADMAAAQQAGCERESIRYYETTPNVSVAWRMRQGTTCDQRFNTPTNMHIAAAPANGSAVIVDSHTFTYTPRPGFVGTDSFTVDLGTRSSGRRGASWSPTVLVTVTVTR